MGMWVVVVVEEGREGGAVEEEEGVTVVWSSASEMKPLCAHSLAHLSTVTHISSFCAPPIKQGDPCCVRSVVTTDKTCVAWEDSSDFLLLRIRRGIAAVVTS